MFIYIVHPSFDHNSTSKFIWVLFANSEDSDEMLHNMAFHQGLHCLPRQNSSTQKETHIFGKLICDPSVDLPHSGAFLRHFIEYALLKGSGVFPLYVARDEALWQKMV